MDDDTSSLLPSTVFTTFETTSKFLVVGCPSCESNLGLLRLHNLPSMKLRKGYVGDKNYGFIAQSVVIRENVEGSE